jgi:hypothetical protein
LSYGSNSIADLTKKLKQKLVIEEEEDDLFAHRRKIVKEIPGSASILDNTYSVN